MDKPIPSLRDLIAVEPSLLPSVVALRDLCNSVIDNPDNFDAVSESAETFVKAFEPIETALMFFTQGYTVAQSPMVRLSAALETARKS